MQEFGQWLSAASTTAETALEACLRLFSIHPFYDGNGRTARLLMHQLLMKDGYPPLVVRPEDRIDYLDSIEKYQLHDDSADCQALMWNRLDAALDDYLRFLEPEED